MEEKAASIPFWQDLFSVTDAVPPWGLFKVLAENPEIILRTPIPLTFLLAPGDKIEARLCTGLDDKLLIRRSSLKEPITWDTMVQNLKAVFDARGSDGQPFVCTIYGEDWKPRYVLAEIFNLFILYLRYSCGETLSSSYGQEEQREAAALFPPNIACVQAYIPLQSQTRYLAVTLRTPINTLMEVYRTSHVGQGCFPNSKDTLDSIITQHPHGENDLYQPLDSSNADAKSANRITASVLCCLRTQCHLKVLGLVCEFVRDVHGDLYLFAVSRCSKPQVKTFQAVVKPWRPSENQLVRILGAKYKTAPPSKPRKVPSISDANITPQTASQTPKQSKKNSLTLVVDGEECKEGSQTSSVRQKGPRKSLAINVNVEEDEGQADEGQARCLDSVKSDGSEEVFPFGQDPSEGEALSKLHLNLILRAQELHDQGSFEEAIEVLADAEKAALDAIGFKQPEQAAAMRANPPNSECFRCGDTVYANFDKSGYAHFEWRSKASSAAARETSKKLQEKNKLINSRRSRKVDQLDQVLQKLEISSYAFTTRGEYDVESKRTLPTTMCDQCLHECQSDDRNRQYIRGIHKFRNEVSISVHAGARQ